MADFVMPALGADMVEGTLVAWHRQPGESVQRGDIVAEVETEKGIIEIEVFTSGVIQRLLVEPGTKVPVGTPLAVIDESASSERREAEAGGPPAHPVEEAPEENAPHLLRPASTESHPPQPAHPAVHSTPSARHLAREAGVDLDKVQGTGRHGVVTRADVERVIEVHAASPSAQPVVSEVRRPRVSPLARRRAQELAIDLAAIVPSSLDGVVHAKDVESEAERAAERRAKVPPVMGSEGKQAAMRRAIATAMSHAKREIPHYYLSTTIDLGPAMKWLASENEERSVVERLIPGVLFLKAVALALRELPELNAHWTGSDAPPLSRIHVGVAISLRQGGLIAPAIHDADQLSLSALMTAFKDLVQRARSGGLKSSEMSDATITVTSLGERGVDTVFPIIHPPQVAMVGFGRIVERPWSVAGQVVSRNVVTATLAADHRVSDGHRGGRYLAAIERLLQAPEKL